jgi:5,10-methylenetetrahydromethanopterin reductase
MSQPFRIGVMQLTMEPVGEILAHARLMDEQGIDTIWLAEAYPWWRKHQMEARSSTALSPLIASATERLTIGWGIISPYTRHPIQVGMEARVTQETAGPGRFRLGFGASKIFMKEIGEGEDGRRARPLAAIRDSVNIVRGVLAGEELDYEGRQFSAKIPALSSDADAPRDEVPIYIGATGPKMRQLAAELADGLLLPSITTPAFTAYARSELDQAAAEAGRDPAAIDLGCTIVASIHPTDREKGRAGAREIAGMYLANKVQNIQGAADTLLELAGLSQTEIQPVADAMERGGRLAAAEAITDEMLDKCNPIAGTPEDCIAAINEYRDAGCSHIMLELWGDDRAEQIKTFGQQVLPQVGVGLDPSEVPA